MEVIQVNMEVIWVNMEVIWVNIEVKSYLQYGSISASS